ncbi:MAG: IS66 family transposase [Chitinophagaceae bacterium]
MQTTETIDYKHLFEQAQFKIASLSHELDNLKRMLFGSRQERFIADTAKGQAIQGTLDLNADVVAACKITETTKVTHQQTRSEVVTQRKEHHGRMKLPDHLRREVIVLEPGEDVTGLRRIGYEVTEVLEYLPGELFVKQFLRPVYVQPTSDIDTTFITAALPGRMLEKCMAGEGLLTQMVVDKYMDHLPINRQLQRFERVGVIIPQSTSNDWMRNTLNSLIGIYELHKKQVLESSYLHADETTIRVQDENKKGKTHLGYYWVYHNSEQKLALFDYQKGRGREGPDEILKNFKGYLQTDGYGTYDDFDLRADITQLHCMAHSRRKFSEAMGNDAPRATYVLERMQALYAVERRIKEESLSPDQIIALRQSESLPVLKELKEWMLAQISIVLPKSAIGKAIAYSLKRWDKLSIYTTDARLQIDNNAIEREIRPVALGRKNYMFAGSHDAAQRGAMIYSLFATCRLHKINPYHWLKDVLIRMPNYTTKNLHELLPQNWKPANHDQ